MIYHCAFDKFPGWRSLRSDATGDSSSQFDGPGLVIYDVELVSLSDVFRSVSIPKALG